MRELAVTQVTPASAGELKRVLTELEPLPVPALTMKWRGRASGKVLDGRIEVKMAPAAGGKTAVTCRYRFTGPLAWLIADDEYERLRGNLQYIGAVVCHRAEQRSGSRCDGRPPPSGKASRTTARTVATDALAGPAPAEGRTADSRGVGRAPDGSPGRQQTAGASGGRGVR
jgi:hypothetical protein